MSRLETLEAKVEATYKEKDPDRDELADWLYEHHVLAVADYADALAERFEANKELARAAALLQMPKCRVPPKRTKKRA